VSDTCLAAVFAEAGKPLELQQLPLPDLGEGEALVRVTCCTVCGSDLHTYEGRRSTPMPTILGHEILGEIAVLGPGEPVRDFSGRALCVGDRVTWSIAASCGACFFCTHGLPQKCEHLLKYGHERIRPEYALSGGLAEHCHLAKGTAILRVPDVLPDVVACPANCATATVAAAFRLGGGCADETVLVQGAGMLGLTACAMARSDGAREVIVCDVDEDRLQLASQFGATRCVRIGEDGKEVAAAVEEATSGRGVDLAIELSGAPSAVEAGLELLRIGGRYVLVGSVFPQRAVSIAAESVVRRLLTIRGLHNYTPADLDRAIAFLSANHERFPFRGLVSDTFPLVEAQRAFTHAIAARVLRVAVCPGG
jgi:putative phosphonate catabolism associated alcohol dehydrogenase